MPRTCKKKHMKIPQVYRKFNEDHDDDSKKKKKKGGRKKQHEDEAQKKFLAND